MREFRCMQKPAIEIEHVHIRFVARRDYVAVEQADCARGIATKPSHHLQQRQSRAAFSMGERSREESPVDSLETDQRHRP